MPLKRQLSLLDAFSVGAGAMVSSGLFVLPGLIYGRVGPAVILAYLAAGVLYLPTILATSELSTAMPKAGGNFFFVTRGLGALAGTVGGLADWFSVTLKSAFALIGISAFARLAFPGLDETGFKLVAVGGALLFTLLNLYSVKIAGKVQVVLTLSLLGILIYYTVAGLGSLDLDRFEPFFNFSEQSTPFALFASTVGMAFISFGGLTKITSLGEEIHDPVRNIPRAMFIAFIVVQLLGVFAVAVTVGLIGGDGLAGSLTPFSDGGLVFGGRAGQIILAAAAMMAFITTANAGIMSAGRVPLAMSRDHLTPPLFARVSTKRNTPVISLVFTGGVMIILILFLDLEGLVKVASASLLFMFCLVNLSLIALRLSKQRNYRPHFHVPLFPVLQVLAIAVYLFLITQLGAKTLLLFGGLVLLGLLWYVFYARRHVRSQSALVVLTERVLSRKLGGDKVTDLSSELREIVKERDEIVFDRFDELVKEAEILDIDDELTADELFHLLAEHLDRHLHLDRETIYQLLVEREAESTTAISPGLAIPHVICPGENRFDLMMVRCLPGIDFGGNTGPVQFVFVLAGSRDERNFHLRALMAIAQVVRNPVFQSVVQTAGDIEEVREAILLAQRQRGH
jgi:amino acid transporter/mannitol/fructose-specific phosphotransferase system IIA component (Ntr-type)